MIASLIRMMLGLKPPQVTLGMTLAGNAVAIRQRDGSYVVRLMPGADRVSLLWGSILVCEGSR